MFKLFVVALAVESLWESLKMVWQENKLNFDRIGSIILGVLLCVTAKVDFFKLVDVPLSYDIIGYILSGILVSRGSNFIHDFLSAVEKINE